MQVNLILVPHLLLDLFHKLKEIVCLRIAGVDDEVAVLFGYLSVTAPVSPIPDAVDKLPCLQAVRVAEDGAGTGHIERLGSHAAFTS